jgi:hypothetical protein
MEAGMAVAMEAGMAVAMEAGTAVAMVVGTAGMGTALAVRILAEGIMAGSRDSMLRAATLPALALSPGAAAPTSARSATPNSGREMPATR